VSPSCRDGWLQISKSPRSPRRRPWRPTRRGPCCPTGCRTWTRPKITGRIRSIARNGTTWYALVERPNLARSERFRLLASTNLGRTWRVRANRTAMKQVDIPNPIPITVTK